MKLNKTILLGLVFGLTTVSTVWAGDSGGPLAQPQRQDKYSASQTIPTKTPGEDFVDVQQPSKGTTDDGQRPTTEDKYSADERPTSDRGTIFSIPLQFFLHLTDAMEEGALHDSRVTISQDRVTGELEVTAETPEAAEVIYSRGEWLY